MRFLPALVLVCVAIISFSGARPKPSKSGEWDSFLKDFIERYFVLHPDFAVYSGRHEFDGRFPDWTPDGLKAQAAWLHDQRKTAMSYDGRALDDRQRFERDYLAAIIDKDLFWLEEAEAPFRNPTFYSIDPNVYVARPYAPLETRMRAYTMYAKGIPSVATQIRKNLRTPLPRTFVDIGRITFGGLASYYANDVPAVFAGVKDQALQSEFKAANAEAIKAMKELDAWFAGQAPMATSNFALGTKVFADMLRATELVDTPLDDLMNIGKADLERNLVALRDACAAYAPGKTVAECIRMVQSRKPTGGPIDGARKQLSDLRKYVVEKNLVSVPGTEEAQVQEAPPYQRWNFAYIDIPGPYEKGLPSVYYIAPPDTSWTPKEREEYIPGEADLLFTSVHEVWPGHFLQFLHSNRSPSKFGQIFVGYAFAEGWAHYAEEMMWEAGLGSGDQETHIGQLLNALLRNVRFISAIGLHTGTMTVEDSEKMFREKAYQDAGTAKQQAARGTFDPAYLNYTMGKLMIRKLRDDWTALRGGRTAWKEFHDKLLSFGGPPIPLVRRALMGKPGPLF
ncbi:MAG: DUF885 domain-containing protein [Bacteroidota bacterium]